MINVDERGYIRCQSCGLPCARVQNGMLIIESRHYGVRHTNVFRIDDMLELLQGEQQAVAVYATPVREG